MDLNQNQSGINDSSAAALAQVADLCAKAFNLEVDCQASLQGFASAKPTASRRGALSVAGRLLEGGVIATEVGLAICPPRQAADVVALFNHLAGLNEKVRLLPPKEDKNGLMWLSAEVRVAAVVMSLSRASVLHDELRRLDALAQAMQEMLPAAEPDGAALAKAYHDMRDALEPVYPWPDPTAPGLEALGEFARQAAAFLEGGACLALASPFELELSLGLAMLAKEMISANSTLGLLALSAINSSALLELARKAPGHVVVPATRLNLGSNVYEMGSEIRALLAGLAQRGRPVVFSGSFEQLQSVLHGGQGAANDPLSPVVLHVPTAPLESLVEFSLTGTARAGGGLPPVIKDQVGLCLLTTLESRPAADQKRLLPGLTRHCLGRWRRGLTIDPSECAAFADSLGGLSETFGGLSPRPRARRRPSVQERYTKVLAGENLLPTLEAELLGQSRALGELAARLRMEALTRPAHQPLRYCAQGTPGTGKSQSAEMVARLLDIPYVNIDAASMPDFHTAAAQLLGSGRGIVMSHLPGRLEQVAKQHTGCLVEVSDLDHAPAQVRAPLADLFLQLLETGEAQSSTGGVFSCADLILAFTMNLPGGADEEVRKGIGFANRPSRTQVQASVVKEIKQILSGAFLSRVGQPILFDPLDQEALAAILEGAVLKALNSAASRLGRRIAGCAIAPGLGLRLVAALENSLVSFGARAILEHGRSLAASAFAQWAATASNKANVGLIADLNKEGKIALTEI